MAIRNPKKRGVAIYTLLPNGVITVMTFAEIERYLKTRRARPNAGRTSPKHGAR